ncbi:AraC family transcriptional regulator [Neptunitalea lumnitzerae]|uniref:Transcription regulator n=1 Tax=Neptunitalea lumnitzerae TaxID=2965509 RepID=A0ABQ5MLY5_9FLAO|nr:AraC family transcriptional regulator [Neptunitalea sp. Y10]GLB50423.1 transcription regulator [Neptunitalea sp. Y10]
MERYKQFDRLIVDDFTTSVWEHPLHNHNHYELIFIVRGKGLHHLNKHLVPYQSGYLYLLGPEDVHEFMIEEETRFIYFKFTNLYLDTFVSGEPSEWNKDIDCLLNLPQIKRGDLLHNEADKKLAEQLFILIAEEYKKNEVLSKRIIFQMFKAILLVLKRNKNSCGSKQQRNSQPEITEALLEYIELNIYEPKSLTLKMIAEHFNYSPNYIGSFFKEKVGTSLKSYVQQYRFNLLEQRLKHSAISNKQLAIEFGFTDESHLYKFVKSYSGKSFAELKNSSVVMI